MQTKMFGEYYSEEAFWTMVREMTNDMKNMDNPESPCSYPRHKDRESERATLLNALTLFYVYQDGEIVGELAQIVENALGYFVADIDIMPRMLPRGGFFDENTILQAALYEVRKYHTPEHDAAAKKQLEQLLA